MCLRLFMSSCVYIYLSIYLYIYMYIYICMYMYIYIWLIRQRRPKLQQKSLSSSRAVRAGRSCDGSKLELWPCRIAACSSWDPCAAWKLGDLYGRCMCVEKYHEFSYRHKVIYNVYMYVYIYIYILCVCVNRTHMTNLGVCVCVWLSISPNPWPRKWLMTNQQNMGCPNGNGDVHHFCSPIDPSVN